MPFCTDEKDLKFSVVFLLLSDVMTLAKMSVVYFDQLLGVYCKYYSRYSML